TSAAVAGSFAPGVAAVYIATGEAFPDALAAAAAAGAQGAPLLLTAPVTLSHAVNWRIGVLQPSRAVVAGGPSAVSEAVIVAVRDAVAR
ncbi:MAG TPA: cell wall-binding repeat-containing protein, partial [Candidatus Limnocylindrales bacterium]|nr:cell wall-binding repeat-containing protein [Candidatus Limnocylindrales bacterium]